MRVSNLRALGLGIAMLGAILIACGSASASGLSDFPEAFGEVLGITPYAAKMIFSVAGIVTVSMVLAVFEVKLPGFLIAQLGLIGVFVAIGWMDLWLLVLAAIIVAVSLASQVRGPLSADGG